MSKTLKNLKQIEDLNVNQLADALEFNGYAECVQAILIKSIDGEQFLKLTEVQISLWRLPTTHARRLWSFIQQVRKDPTQLLINTQSQKMTTKANTPNNALQNQYVAQKSNDLSRKPNVSVKPLHVSADISKSATVTENTSSKFNETNISSLTKQESNFVKNKLEHMFKNDSNATANVSFVHKYQPRIPPQPLHLKPKHSANDQLDECGDDYNDGYLLPRQINLVKQDRNRSEASVSVNVPVVSSPTFSRKSFANKSFLSQFKKGYEHLEKRPQVDENKYEEQNNKAPKVNPRVRPLPPVPLEICKTEHQLHIESDDKQLAEYTSVPDDDEHFNNLIRMRETPLEANKLHQSSSFNRFLPNVQAASVTSTSQPYREQKRSKSEVVEVNENNEELPEYALLDEEESNTVTEIRRNKLCPLLIIPIESTYNINESFRHHQAVTILLDDDPQLPEYTSILDDDDNSDTRSETEAIKKISTLQPCSPFHRPLPPVPLTSPDSITAPVKEKQKQRLPALRSNEEDLSVALQKLRVLQPSSKELTSPARKLKPRVEIPDVSRKSPLTLPKPPACLTVLPMGLPSSPEFVPKQDDSCDYALEVVSKPEHRPLLPLPAPPSVEESIEKTDLQATKDEDLPFYSEIDLASDPCYRDTDRKGARLLLTGLEDGAYIIRPSRQQQYICTISIMHKTKMFNLGIQKDAKGVLRFGSITPDFQQPTFYGIGDIISYYRIHPLYLSGESVTLKSVLPHSTR